MLNVGVSQNYNFYRFYSGNSLDVKHYTLVKANTLPLQVSELATGQALCGTTMVSSLCYLTLTGSTLGTFQVYLHGVRPGENS